MKEFTKSDLKDGMVVAYRNGDERVFLGLKLHEECENGFKITSTIDAYLNNLISIYSNDMDIMKVWYMGKTLWERKKYVTFDEARKSGKKIRYCGDLRDMNIEHSDFNPLEFQDASDYMFDLTGECVNASQMNRILDDKMWEVRNDRSRS